MSVPEKSIWCDFPIKDFTVKNIDNDVMNASAPQRLFAALQANPFLKFTERICKLQHFLR